MVTLYLLSVPDCGQVQNGNLVPYFYDNFWMSLGQSVLHTKFSVAALRVIRPTPKASISDCDAMSSAEMREG
jgi:hypothetical protein